jgi:hypothetical protein
LRSGSRKKAASCWSNCGKQKVGIPEHSCTHNSHSPYLVGRANGYHSMGVNTNLLEATHLTCNGTGTASPYLWWQLCFLPCLSLCAILSPTCIIMVDDDCGGGGGDILKNLPLIEPWAKCIFTHKPCKLQNNPFWEWGHGDKKVNTLAWSNRTNKWSQDLKLYLTSKFIFNTLMQCLLWH